MTLNSTLYFTWASQVALVVKYPPANADRLRDMDLIPRLGRTPGGGHGNSLQYSCLENPRGQRSLVGNSPWGHKESDTTEATWHTCTHSFHSSFLGFLILPLQFL